MITLPVLKLPISDEAKRHSLLAAFRLGADTKTLADGMKVHEAVVYNAIARAREEERGQG